MGDLRWLSKRAEADDGILHGSNGSTVGDRAIVDGWHRDDDGDAIGGTGRRCRMLSALCGVFCAVRCGGALVTMRGWLQRDDVSSFVFCFGFLWLSSWWGEKRGRQGTCLAAGRQVAGSRQAAGQQRATSAWKEHPVHVPRRPLLPRVAKHRTGQGAAIALARALFGRRRWMAEAMVVVRVMVMATYRARCNLQPLLSTVECRLSTVSHVPCAVPCAMCPVWPPPPAIMDRLRLRRACRRPAAATRTSYFDHGHSHDLDMTWT
jgi:hypothetical protein